MEDQGNVFDKAIYRFGKNGEMIFDSESASDYQSDELSAECSENNASSHVAIPEQPVQKDPSPPCKVVHKTVKVYRPAPPSFAVKHASPRAASYFTKGPQSIYEDDRGFMSQTPPILFQGAMVHPSIADYCKQHHCTVEEAYPSHPPLKHVRVSEQQITERDT